MRASHSDAPSPSPSKPSVIGTGSQIVRLDSFPLPARNFSYSNSRCSPLKKFTRVIRRISYLCNRHVCILRISAANLMRPNPPSLQLEYKMAWHTWWKVKPLLDWISNKKVKGFKELRFYLGVVSQIYQSLDGISPKSTFWRGLSGVSLIQWTQFPSFSDKPG